MQKKRVVNKMSWKEIMDTRREFREECRLNGMGEALFASDAGIPTKKYAAEKDNRNTRHDHYGIRIVSKQVRKGMEMEE